MLSNNQKNTFQTSGAQADVSARVLNADSAEHTRKSDRDKKFLLLVLLIMLLVITQVIVLLAGSGIDQVSEPAIVSDSVITQKDIKAVNDELKAVMKSLDETEPEEVAEVIKSEKKHVFVQPAVKVENKIVILSPIITTNDVALSSDNTITKRVEKRLGYVKHDSEGESLADNSVQWTCVHDTTTGLMWEVKSNEDAMRNSNNLYSWYNPEHKSLPGNADGGRCKGGTDCDTNAYVHEMNKRNYCGFNDWGLPTKKEMQTLVQLKNGQDKVKINKRYFPQAVPSWYWTSSDEDNKNEFAWYVLFRNGFVLSDLKERAKHVRLVRKVLITSGIDSNVYQ